MFCKKCGMEFRDECNVCIDCGVARPLVDEWELDWEDAARLNEERESAAIVAASIPISIAAQRSNDACIHPDDERKSCLDCGKALPSSAMSDICTMCTVQRSKRVAQQSRQQKTTPPTASREDDRYAYAASAAPTVYSSAPTSYSNETRPIAKPKKPLQSIIMLVIVFVVATNILSSLGSLLFNTPSTTESIISDLNAPASYSAEESAIYEQFIQPIAEQFFDSLAAKLEENGNAVQLHSDTPNFISMHSDYSQLESDGVNNFLRGDATFSLDGDLYYVPFRICLVFIEDGGAYTTYFELLDTIYWSYLDQPLETLIKESPITLHEIVKMYS